MTSDTAAVRAVCGAGVQDARGRVLLLRRRGEGTWGLPGGGVEAGETWARATVRECLEETAWEIELDGLLGLYSDASSQVHRYPDGHVVHFVGAVFLAHPLREVGVPNAEAEEIGWFALDALPRPLFSPDRPPLEDVTAPKAERPFMR